ncbi:MAG: glycosyltransferase [Pleomorphochaeta sp.]
MIHYKSGGTDGVSLEMDKWKLTLEIMGHKVSYLAGEMNNEIVYEPLFHTSQIAKDFYAYSFQNKLVFKDEKEYREKVNIEVLKCEKIIKEFIEKNNIELVIVQNIFSVAMNISVAIALENVLAEKKLKVLAQHHDFFWERKAGVKYGCDFAKEIANKYLPPSNKTYKHVVINQQGHDTLLKRKKLESYIVPNVFDFKAPLWKIDDYNKDFKKDLNISEKDIMFLQATRIVDRKAIELAIDLIAMMNKTKEKYYNKTLYDGRIFTKGSNFLLVLAGYDGDDDSGTYLKRLKNHANKNGVKIKIISDRISHERRIEKDQKIYSLWDTYVFADMITYPSYWEGWGNQFLEGLFSKKPIALFEYPVFKSDIKNKGFKYISLGDTYKTDNKTDLVYIDEDILKKASLQTYNLLFDKTLRNEIVEKNFNIGEKNFSMEALYKQLEYILKS